MVSPQPAQPTSAEVWGSGRSISSLPPAPTPTPGQGQTQWPREYESLLNRRRKTPKPETSGVLFCCSLCLLPQLCLILTKSKARSLQKSQKSQVRLGIPYLLPIQMQVPALGVTPGHPLATLWLLTVCP